MCSKTQLAQNCSYKFTTHIWYLCSNYLAYMNHKNYVSCICAEHYQNINVDSSRRVRPESDSFS